MRTLLTFSAPTGYAVGPQADGFVPNAAPRSAVSADLNGDGKLDLIVTHTSNNSVYFLRGNGNGTFQPAVATAVGTALQGDVFLGDFNGDGKTDLFLPGNAGQAIIMPGNGDGTFRPAVVSSSFNVSGYYPRGWAVGDFNGDGKLDVASTLPSNTSDTGRVIVLLGNGNGTFQSGIVSPTGLLHYSRWATTGDLNHDGRLHLAVADGQGTSGTVGSVELTILFGNGDGTFTLGGHYASPQLPDGSNTTATANSEDVVIADVNGDGIPDAIESDYDNTVNVFLGNGDGTFQTARSVEPGNYPRDVVPTDVNGDGKIDLVVTNVGINVGGALFAADGAEPGSVAVLLGNGNGTFQSPVAYSPSAYPGWTAVGDFNGDGHPDLATTQVLDGQTLSVMLDQPTSNNLPPTFVNSPSASPASVNGTTTTLSALGADDGGESNLTYTWSTVGSLPAAVGYSINGTNASKTTTATFTASGTYLFQCKVTDAGGLSFIDLVPVQVSVPPPSTTLGTPTAVSPGSATAPGPVLTTATPTLTWTAVAGVTGYQVHVVDLTTNVLASYSTGASVTSLTLPAGALTQGHKYLWYVRGANGTANAPASAPLYFQVFAISTAPTLTAPTAISPGTSVAPGPLLTTTSPTLTWTAVSGVTGYQVHLGDVTTNTLVSYSTGASVTSLHLPVGALIPGHKYVWYVFGVNGTTNGPASAPLYFQVPAATTTPTMTAPTALTPGTSVAPGPLLTTTSPTLTWTAVSGVTGYQVHVVDLTTNVLVSYSTGASVTSLTLPAGALTLGHKYLWYVRGVNGTVNGPASSPLYFQAPPAPKLAAPVILGPGTSKSPGSALTTMTPTLSWNAVTGAGGYQVTLYNVTTHATLIYKLDANTTSITIPAGALKPSTTYVWNVRILDGTQSGPPSTYLYFHTPSAMTAIAVLNQTLNALAAARTATSAKLATADPSTPRYAHLMHALHKENKEIKAVRKETSILKS